LRTAMLRHDLPWLRANLDHSVLTNYEISSVLVLDARNWIVYAIGHPPSVADLWPAIFQAPRGTTLIGNLPQPALIASAPIDGNIG